MNEPVWKLVYNRITQQTDVVWRRWPDGREESRSGKDPEYCRWLAEGNKPIPADEGEQP